YGNRLAASIVAAPGVAEADVLTAALVSSVRDETPEGRSVVELARERLNTIGAPAGVGDQPGLAALDSTIAEFIPFRAETRTSGVRLRDGQMVLKGAVDAIAADVEGGLSPAMAAATDRIAGLGATPLAVRRDGILLGLIELKDTVKEGLPE